jgi:conjugal transfer pilus assembly protein TraB
MAEKKKLFQKWAEMSPKARMIISIGGLFVIVLVVSSLFMPKDQSNGSRTKPLSSSNFQVPGGQKDLSVENLAGRIDALKAEQAKEQQDSLNREKQFEATIQQLRQANTATPPTSGSLELEQQVKTLKKELDDMKTGKARPPSLDDSLASAKELPPKVGAPTPKRDEGSKIRIISGEPRPDVEGGEQGGAAGTVAFMPTGSMFEGVLMNGMEAPTSSVTQKNPVPALVRIKTDAVLPNNFRKDIRECFVIVSGFGVLSTERAQLRTEALSCVRNDGGVIDTKIDGYVVGEDGKVGMRGRLVSKQGQVIAQSLMVGFVQGLGMAFQPQAVPAMNINPTGTMQYQMPSVSMMAGMGVAGGISQAASSISQFYLSMAKEMFPVVEVDAGRKVTIVIMKGFEMDLDSKDAKK